MPRGLQQALVSVHVMFSHLRHVDLTTSILKIGKCNKYLWGGGQIQLLLSGYDGK